MAMKAIIGVSLVEKSNEKPASEVKKEGSVVRPPIRIPKWVQVPLARLAASDETGSKVVRLDPSALKKKKRVFMASVVLGGLP